MNKNLSVEINNNIEEITRLGDILEEYGNQYNIPPKVIQAFHLALDELVTNTISYGYADKAPHTILLAFVLNEEQLSVTITDDGQAFNPKDAPPPDLDSSVEDRRVGGLGIHLVKNLLDTFDYERKGKYNIVRLSKKI